MWASDGGRGPATVVWAVIALPLLAVWVPAGTLCAAPPRARRRLLVPLAVGVVTAAALGYALATGPVTAEIRGHTVGYAVGLSHPALLVAGYLAATVGALLLSGDRWLVGLGGLVAVGAAGCWALWAAGVRVDLVRGRGGVLGRAVRVDARAVRRGGNPGGAGGVAWMNGAGRPARRRRTGTGAGAGQGARTGAEETGTTWRVTRRGNCSRRSTSTRTAR